LAYTVKTLDLGTVLVIAADMPLITAEIIDEVVDRFVACGKPSLAVAVPVETKRGLGMGLDYAFEHCGQSVVPAGINMIEGKLIDVGELPQEVYVLDKAEVAVNINTVDELRTARKQFARLRGSGNRG
jgi:adenosylcobinamide-phosphate guanylyltransferase